MGFCGDEVVFILLAQCLLAARDGHGESSFSQLYKLEKALVEGAIPNATSRLQGTTLKVARIEEGSRVEANYRDRGKYYPGRVKRDRRDGTYDIDYNDGEQEMRVPADMIRLPDEPGATAAPDVGDKVEANFKGRGKWFPGIVKRLRFDGSYDIHYDDGEIEIEVPADLVRILRASKNGASPRIEEGSKVEVNCNALFYALGLHRSPEQRRYENIAAVACLLSRNADLPAALAEVYKGIVWMHIKSANIEYVTITGRT